MGLNDSAVRAGAAAREQAGEAFMWTYDGRTSKRLRSSLVSDRRLSLYERD